VSHNVRILVVDDNDDDIELLRISLARSGSGFELVPATSTAEARAGLENRERRPDLVLLDWKMPAMDGPEFLRHVRADPRTVGMPVIVFSSSDDPADVRAAYGAGASAYVLKPPGFAEYESFGRDICAFWCRMVPYRS
jgi:two-component system response regulator